MAFTGTIKAATPLQAARLAKDWKQARAIAALEEAAQSAGATVASRASLKTMLSRWENGEWTPEPKYRRLFCRIYDATEEELGFLDDELPPITSIMVAPAPDANTVDYFQARFRATR